MHAPYEALGKAWLHYAGQTDDRSEGNAHNKVSASQVMASAAIASQHWGANCIWLWRPPLTAQAADAAKPKTICVGIDPFRRWEGARGGASEDGPSRVLKPVGLRDRRSA
jgi:hypothetical protein